MLGNARTNLVRTGVSTLATLVVMPFIIRHIGLEKYSYVALTSFFISFSGFFDWGLSKSLVYLLNDPSADMDRRNEYLTVQVLVIAGIIILLFGTGLFAVLTHTSVLGKSLLSTDSHFVVVTLSCFCVLALTVFDQFQCSVLESFFLLQYVNQGTTVKVMTLNALYLLNLFTWNDVSLYVFSPVLAILASAAYNGSVLHRSVSWHFCRPSGEAVKMVAVHSFHFFRFSMLNSLYSALPRLSVLYISTGLSYIGMLDVIEKLSLSVINFCSSILRPLFSLSRQTPRKVARHLPKVMLLNGGIGLAFVATIVGGNGFIVRYYFSRTVDVSFVGRVLVLYSLGSFFLLLAQPLSFYLQGEGKANRLSMLFGINIVLYLSLYIGMIEWLQMDALIGLSLCSLIVSSVYLFNLCRLARTVRHSRLLAF